MKKTMLRLLGLSILFVSLLAFDSCRKDKVDIPVTPSSGSLNIQFNYVFGMSSLPWELNKQMVHPLTGDTLTFSTFKYYVSNIKLKAADGSWWVQPESYYLLDAKSADASSITLTGVPPNNYTAMEYTMGVDSARNVSGANTGALSLSNGMFWDWNSGYIMLKAEGYSPNSTTGTFAFHLGGFSGTNNIVTVKSADFGKTITINSATKVYTVKLLANPAKLWHSSPSVKVRSTIHMPGAEAVTMAKDFYNNISLSAVE